jgi:hypothetical protein
MFGMDRMPGTGSKFSLFARRLEHLSAASQCCGRNTSLMTYLAISEGWLQQALVEGFPWASSLCPLILRGREGAVRDFPYSLCS